MTRTRPQLPSWSPAAGDLRCWLEAAYPRRGAHLPTTLIADDLNVSPSTIRRWLRDDHTGLTRTQRAYLARRAILRGRGTYLWPQLDQDTLTRQAHQAGYAARLAGRVDAGDIDPLWRGRGDLDPYWVVLAYYPRAHAYAVSIGRTSKALSRIGHRAEVLHQGRAPHRFAAQVRKHDTLSAYGDRRCVVPTELIPTGHSDALRVAIGAPTPSLARTSRTR